MSSCRASIRTGNSAFYKHETVLEDRELPSAGRITAFQTASGPDSFIDDFRSVDGRGLSHQDCEGLFQVGKQSPDIAGGVHVDRDDLHAILAAEGTQQPHRSKQHHGSQQQQATNKQRQQAGQTEEEEEKENEEGEEKKRGEKEMKERERRKGERGKKEEGRDAEEEEREQVKKDVMGWTVVTRSKKHRKRTVQIFVKMDGCKTSALEMKMSDKVDDLVKKIPIIDQDVYVTSGGRILRRSDKQ